MVADPKDNAVTPTPIPSEAAGTLIISPLSLLSNWTSQIEEHLQPSTLSVLVFHGSNKSDPKIDISDYDVVVTSYGTLVSDYKATGLGAKAKGSESSAPKKPRKSKRSLFGRIWRRVVLDEGHTIRNPNAKMSLAAESLEAVSRWTLTGLFDFLLH